MVDNFKIKIEELNFSDFINREDNLSKIYRYEIYDESFYRSNLELHSLRVYFLILSSLSKIAELFPEADLKKIQIMALVHDDAEILTGDHPSSMRLNMSSDQISIIDEKEKIAIVKLKKDFPLTIGGYVYTDLLTEVFEKSTIESQLVKFFDHSDGFGEALHEIFAGNICFVTSPNTEVGNVPIPPDYYIPRFSQPEKFYPLIAGKINSEIPFSRNFDRIDFENIAKFSVKHDESSIVKPTGYPIYDWWKDTLLKSDNIKINNWLISISPKIYLK